MTLFVSDLDGTLLNSDSELTKDTIETINKIIEKRCLFTIATGRSLFYSNNFIKQLGISIPVILSNGVYIYDPITKKYLNENYINENLINDLMDIFKEYKLHPYIYALDKLDQEKIFHLEINSELMQKIYDFRIKANDNRQTLIRNYSSILGNKIISITLFDYKEKLEFIYRDFVKMKDITTYFTEDNRFPGQYWLEIFSCKASKGEAIIILKDLIKSEKVVCFGDGTNDLSMFEVSDEKIAVENALEFIKLKATQIIGCNNNDAVAKYMKAMMKLS